MKRNAIMLILYILVLTLTACSQENKTPTKYNTYNDYLKNIPNEYEVHNEFPFSYAFPAKYKLTETRATDTKDSEGYYHATYETELTSDERYSRIDTEYYDYIHTNKPNDYITMTDSEILNDFTNIFIDDDTIESKTTKVNNRDIKTIIKDNKYSIEIIEIGCANKCIGYISLKCIKSPSYTDAIKEDFLKMGDTICKTIVFDYDFDNN